MADAAPQAGQCPAIDPEGRRCAQPAGHEGLHVPTVPAVAAPAPTTWPARIVGVVLVVFGVFGFLLVPIVVMFSEGVPEDFPGGLGTYVSLWAAIAFVLVLAGFGILRGRPWGRVLGIGMLVVLGVVGGGWFFWAVAVAGILVLAFRWGAT
jgi:hypothetical protein